MATSIEQLDLSKKYSYADYLKWFFDERLELIKGFIHKMSPAPSRRHQDIVGAFSRVFLNQFYKQPCKVYFAPFDVRIPKKDKTSNKDIVNVLQPDLCVVCDLSKLDERGCVGAPDLVVEVLSPGNSVKEMKLKFDVYEESGVKEYWIVNPHDKNVFIYTLNNTGKFVGQHPLTDEDELVSFLFPALKINLKDVFEE